PARRRSTSSSTTRSPTPRRTSRAARRRSSTRTRPSSATRSSRPAASSSSSATCSTARRRASSSRRRTPSSPRRSRRRCSRSWTAASSPRSSARGAAAMPRSTRRSSTRPSADAVRPPVPPCRGRPDGARDRHTGRLRGRRRPRGPARAASPDPPRCTMTGRTPGGDAAGAPGDDPVPDRIHARPVPRPGRWVSAVVLLVLAAMAVNALLTNEKFRWDVVWLYFRDVTVVRGVGWTLVLTFGSMLIAIVLAVLLAIMRRSDNPVMKAVSWGYIWFFRGTPIYTQLVFWGLISVLYPRLSLGIPFGPEFFEFRT